MNTSIRSWINLRLQGFGPNKQHLAYNFYTFRIGIGTFRKSLLKIHKKHKMKFQPLMLRLEDVNVC